MKIIGIVLAGGMSRRFGRPKAFVVYKEKYFYEWAKEVLRSNTDELVIVSHPDLKKEFERNGEEHIEEDAAPFQGKGPLAGIYTVMKAYEGEWYGVLPCDTPKMTPLIIKKMKDFITEDVEAVVPIINGKYQPLIAMYHKRTESIIGERLAEGDYRVSSLLDRCRVRWVTEKELEVDGEEFENINDETAFQSLLDDGER
ncbi:molybdenum cofactor guanylyltransferase [Priestia abyssalis]|uniref:molybdenum cofactor guanylyltransferase n=1 Tax=Priestia abyssalis TaxID=1221450 RepID=UPI000994D8DF|nr:molybdenum cofactor guanylyltransferase [Priestia abyssalis]